MTPDEIRDLNRQALERLQDLTEALWHPNGSPGGLALELNSHTERRMNHFRLMSPYTGQWCDLTGAGAGSGDDLIDLVAWMADIDRDDAAPGLRDFLARLPPPPPPVSLNPHERYAAERPKHRAAYAPSTRSIRRG